MRTDGFGSRLRSFYSKHSKFVNAIVILLGAYATLAGIGVFYKPLSPESLLRKEHTDAVARYVLSYGWAAPIFFVALQVCQVVILPIPGQVIGIVAGYIFGWKLGVTYTMFGLALGMIIVFTLSRKLGRGFVEKLNGPEAMRDLETLFSSRDGNSGGFYQKSAQTLRSNALLTFFLFMLLPGLPDNLACFVAGLTRIPVRLLLLAALVGRFPAALTLSLFGDGWSKAESSTTLLALAGAALALTVVFLWKKQRIEAIVRKVAGWSDT
ncbi:MAG: VTT domain-containing protein [Blastocatellia bacterium]